MNGVQIFKNSEFGTLEVAIVDGKEYFPATGCARLLGYSNPQKAVRDHCKGCTKRSVLTSGGKQEINLIPEGDLYRLIVRSNLPSAERFEKWVFDEVLPSIRSNGGYIAGQEKMSPEQILANAVLVAQNVIEKQKAQLEAQAPKVKFAERLLESKSSILVGTLAKLLSQNGVDTGSVRLFRWMRDNGFLIKRIGAEYNCPTQRSMDMGLMEVKETIIRQHGVPVIRLTPKVTPKGQAYFLNCFLKNNYQQMRL